MMSRRVPRWLLLIAICSTTLAAAPAMAQGRPQASEAFERGVNFFRDGDFEAAMVEFKQAYQLDPNWRVLYNLGQTSRELRNYSAALNALESYLAEGGQEIDAERRKRVEGWVSELSGKVGTLELSTNVTGAEVTVDDLLVGKTPLAKPVRVNAGRRKISVMMSGYAPLTRSVDVAGTEKKKLRLELVPLTSSSPAAPIDPASNNAEPPPSQKLDHQASPWPWGIFAITAASGITTAVLGGLAISKKSDFDDALTQFPTSKATIDTARDDARTFALAADIMGGVTIAAAIVTVVGFVVEASPSGEAGAVSLGLSPGYVSVSTRF